MANLRRWNPLVLIAFVVLLHCGCDDGTRHLNPDAGSDADADHWSDADDQTDGDAQIDGDSDQDDEISQPVNYLILTDLNADHPYNEAAERLSAFRLAPIIRYSGEISETRDQLLETQPQFVALVTTPEGVDDNLAAELITLASGLDDDPFTDFTYGIITGRTAKDAVDLVDRIQAVETGEIDVPASLLNYAPLGGGESFESDFWMQWAVGYETLSIGSADQQYILDRLDRFEDRAGVVYFGHGYFDGIVDGPEFDHIGLVNLTPAFFVGGACHTGVVSTVYEYFTGTVERTDIDLDQSFALSVLASGATGLIAGLDATHGLIAGEEFEFAVTGQHQAGDVLKHTLDVLVVGANGGEELFFPPLIDGEATPGIFDDFGDMRHSAACRMLFGDPAFQPFRVDVPDPVELDIVELDDGLSVTARVTNTDPAHLFFDLYNTQWEEKAYSEKLYFTVPWPSDLPTPTTIEVISSTSDGAPTEPRTVLPPAIENWLGQTRIHVHINLRPDTLLMATTAEFEIEIR